MRQIANDREFQLVAIPHFGALRSFLVLAVPLASSLQLVLWIEGAAAEEPSGLLAKANEPNVMPLPQCTSIRRRSNHGVTEEHSLIRSARRRLVPERY